MGYYYECPVCGAPLRESDCVGTITKKIRKCHWCDSNLCWSDIDYSDMPEYEEF